jgi:hypothetical protein
MEASMFDDNRDLNRDLGRRDAYLNDAAQDGSGYGPVIALVAIALIIGGLFMFSPSDKTQTASNNSPAVERTAPAPSPAPVTPAPPATAPKQ